jgi:DNA-binding PadR family transcriptional regulator
MLLLWLLWDGPKHVYGMQKMIRRQGKDRVVNVRSRASLYQTIDRLERVGLVEVEGTVRGEPRPDRTIYALTDEGREAAQQWLRETLSTTGAEFPEFIAGLSVLFGLAPDDARAQLEARVASLDQELSETKATLRDNPTLPRLFLLEEEYRRTILQAELKWLRALVGDLESGALTWDQAWLQEIASQFGVTNADAQD